MKKIILLTVAIGLAIALGSISGCASDDGGSSVKSQSPAVVAIPADSKLAKVQLGTSDAAVRKVMGEPDNSNAYMTGKAFIPFYFGPDTHRTDWMYSGQGRVVFSRNRYSGGLKVIKVTYNPQEP